MIIRHENGRYNTIADVALETIVPTGNDVIYVTRLNRKYNWVAGSTALADNNYVIEQLSVSALGRWLATTIEDIHNASTWIPALNNGQFATVFVEMPDVSISSVNLVAILNEYTLEQGIYTWRTVVGDGLVKIVVQNNTGHNIPAFFATIRVIEVVRGTPFNDGFSLGFEDE